MSSSSIPVRVTSGVAISFVALPFIGLLIDIPWSRLGALLAGPTLREALRVSAITVPIATAIIALIGTPLAWMLARSPGGWTRPVRALVLVPVVLPPVVSGLVLLSAFGRRGFLGGLLDSVGIVLPFSLAGTTMAAVFVALPFFVIAAEAGFREVPASTIDAARTLGTPESGELRSVGIPHARQAIVAGVVLAAARALGEFGATITFAGNVEGSTRTLPLATFAALESDPGLARVIGLVLVTIAAAVIYALRGALLGRVR